MDINKNRHYYPVTDNSPIQIDSEVPISHNHLLTEGIKLLQRHEKAIRENQLQADQFVIWCYSYSCCVDFEGAVLDLYENLVQDVKASV